MSFVDNWKIAKGITRRTYISYQVYITRNIVSTNERLFCTVIFIDIKIVTKTFLKKFCLQIKIMFQKLLIIKRLHFLSKKGVEI